MAAGCIAVRLVDSPNCTTDTAGETMNDKAIDDQEIAKWDPEFTKLLDSVVAPLVKRWFRAEVRGLENLPAGRRRFAGVEPFRRRADA